MGELPELVGGVLCLDFVNTLDALGDDLPDHPGGFAELVAWARHAGLVDNAGARRLAGIGSRQPERVESCVAAAIHLREAVYRVFRAVADGTPPPADELDAIKQAYVEAMRRARLVPHADHLEWIWPHDAPDIVWWPVARSAVELATTGPLDRLKRCASTTGCQFLFLDTTKNCSRRWCSMNTCGAELKTQRQTARRRAARVTPVST